MTEQSRTIELTPVSESARRTAESLVRVYDGDQVDAPCVDVGGVFVISATDRSPALLCEQIRGVVAKAIERHVKA